METRARVIVGAIVFSMAVAGCGSGNADPDGGPGGKDPLPTNQGPPEPTTTNPGVPAPMPTPSHSTSGEPTG